VAIWYYFLAALPICCIRLDHISWPPHTIRSVGLVVSHTHLSIATGILLDHCKPLGFQLVRILPLVNREILPLPPPVTKGDWVEETSNLQPTSEMGRKRIEAEQLLLNSNLPVRIFRLASIYSLERNIFSRLKKKEVKIINKKDQIFSRIHVEDIAQVLFSSFSKSKNKDIFNVSDDAPCAYKEVVQYAAALLQVEMPKEINFEDLENSKMKDFYRDRKKVQNSKIKSMGVKLKYPTFKEGLTAIFNQIS
jgi:nucleoside-diphosphate-sugar epimerase